MIDRPAPALELGVTIERVVVRAGVRPDDAPRPVFVSGYLGAQTGAPLHDHRIVIHELWIDIEAALDSPDARRIATQVAWGLAHQLAALQDQRRPQIARRPSRGGPIHVETLRVHLRGEPARHPPSAQVCAAVMSAFEGRIRDAC